MGGDVYATSLTCVSRTGEPGRTDTLRVDDLSGEVVERLDYPAGRWSERLSVAVGSIWVPNGEVPTLVRYDVPVSP